MSKCLSAGVVVASILSGVGLAGAQRPGALAVGCADTARSSAPGFTDVLAQRSQRGKFGERGARVPR